MIMAAPQTLRLIAFRVGPETFVIDIMAVRQIVMYGGSTSLPTAPSFIEGVIVVRNEAIPIVDLRRRFHPGGNDRPAESYVLITHTAAGVIGLKVDEVRRIVTVAREQVVPAPEMVRGIRGDFLIGVVAHGQETLLLLDVESVLTSDEQGELQRAELSPPSSSPEAASDR
jgi:purine-binding chemotaxis protein CheW